MTDSSRRPINWTAVKALYAAITLGIVWMLYWGDYRNAAWLVLIGVGGGLNAYGRLLEERGAADRAKTWQWAGGLVYAVFLGWAVYVLIQGW